MSELKNTGHGLSDIRKGNPFEVPDRYFEDFSARLNDRIHAEKETSRKDYALTWRPYAAAAILLVVALLAGGYFFSNNKGSKADRLFRTEISQVVEQELYSISEEMILEVLEVNTSQTPAGSDISSEDAIEYLMNEDLGEDILDAM
ncbi:MAG: hypothetical protein JW830_00725 [Bacteroidales bacterium]|nr:hypothetical protein [Bacteroidales bacterium]